MDSFRACLLGLLCVCQIIQGEDEVFSAVVVEYSPARQPSVDADTNILQNVANFVQFINKANSGEIMADIIVFPEDGLSGFGNQDAYLEVPDPAAKITPCAHNTTYEAPLVQLSCAAHATNTYVVVNLSERFYNTTEQRDIYYNTNVVFDRNGVIIARYRKIHLYGEPKKSPSPDGALVYFDTDFGVRFGLMTCFDIIFQDPLELARLHNVSHFIFTNAWFSQMPFLTAIQEQWYWSYTADAVLLASGYNMPSVGSSGTGIYLGRQGIAAYAMIETRGSFMLQANLLKQSNSAEGTNSSRNFSIQKGTTTGFSRFLESTDDDAHNGNPPSRMKMKTELLSVFLTEQITLPSGSEKLFNDSGATVHFTVKKRMCQNSLCCDFSAEIVSVFSKTRENITRGDDYSQLYYRLAVFDGVKNYDNFATGGVQTCAIIPCVNSDIHSCGVRSDDSSAQPNTHLDSFYQTEFVFRSIAISGNFSDKDSFVGPNVLLRGEGDDFGSLLLPDGFIFSETDGNASFRTVTTNRNLVVASVYGRVFSRDGQPYSGNQTGSSSVSMYVNILLLIATIAILKCKLGKYGF